MRRFVVFALLAGALAAWSPRHVHAAPINVDTALVLLIDSSGSISNADYALQIQGYAAAFNNPAIVQGMTDGTFGQTAVIAIGWSASSQQQVLAGWSIISDAASATAFANTLSAAARPFSNTTGVAAAINFGVNQLLTASVGGNEIIATRSVIDISSDGIENTGGNVAAARANAFANGVDVINAIVIADPGNFTQAQLVAWYTANVIGGTNEDGSPAFVLGVDNFQQFIPAIEQKLLLEVGVQEVPEPASMAVLGLGALVVGGVYRRNRKGQDKAMAA